MKGEVKVHLGRSDSDKWSIMLFVNELDSKEEAEALVPAVEAVVREKVLQGVQSVPLEDMPPKGSA